MKNKKKKEKKKERKNTLILNIEQYRSAFIDCQYRR